MVVQKYSFLYTQLQCLNVSCLAACLCERATRARAQPRDRKLARAARLGETHPGIRSPVARLKIRFSAPQRPTLPPRSSTRLKADLLARIVSRGKVHKRDFGWALADGRRRCGAAAGGVAQALALALLAAAGLARLSHGACAIGFAGGARAVSHAVCVSDRAAACRAALRAKYM